MNRIKEFFVKRAEKKIIDKTVKHFNLDIMETKSIFKSRTMWFNIAMGVLSITTLINPELLVGLGITAAATQSSVLGITAVVNMILRSMTNTAIVSPSVKAEEAKTN